MRKYPGRLLSLKAVVPYMIVTLVILNNVVGTTANIDFVLTASGNSHLVAIWNYLSTPKGNLLAVVVVAIWLTVLVLWPHRDSDTKAVQQSGDTSSTGQLRIEELQQEMAGLSEARQSLTESQTRVTELEQQLAEDRTTSDYEKKQYDELMLSYQECLRQKIDVINRSAETESQFGLLTSKSESLESRVSELTVELTRYKTSPIQLVYQQNEPYRMIYPAGGRRRVEYYIGISVSVPVEELIVEFDPFRENCPDVHRTPYQLHEKGDDFPYKRFTALTPEDGEQLFSFLTIEEDIHVSIFSTFDVKMETDSGDERIPAAGRIIARGKNALSRERSFYVRTPINSHYRVEFTS